MNFPDREPMPLQFPGYFESWGSVDKSGQFYPSDAVREVFEIMAARLGASRDEPYEMGVQIERDATLIRDLEQRIEQLAATSASLIGEQAQRIEALESQIAALVNNRTEDPVPLNDLRDQLQELRTRIDALAGEIRADDENRLSGIVQQINTIEGRIGDVEAKSSAENIGAELRSVRVILGTVEGPESFVDPATTLAALGGVPTSRGLTAGTGLAGGGDLSADRTFDLEDTAVTPSSYGDATNVATFTVDQQGRLTAAADQAISFPVASVAGKTGTVTLDQADISGLTTASTPVFAGVEIGTLEFTGAGSAAATPANFSAAEYLAITTSSGTRYLALATSTW